MGYLDKSTITVDAILTKRGREKLASGTFSIVKFALADDEIDYNLWDENHGKGTNYYGQAIENLPMVEAVPDQSKVMRFKLMTLGKNIQKLPFLQLTPQNATYEISWDGTGTITAKTSTAFTGGSNFADESYTAIISDGTLAYFTDDGFETNAGGSLTKTNFSVTSGAATIKFTGNNTSEALDKTTTITIIGNTTGITGTTTIKVLRHPAS
jgi:hypothetical protein